MIWTGAAIGSALIGLVVAVMLDEPLRGILAVFVGRRGKIHPLVGTWRATFTMPAGAVHVEVIQIRRRFGRAVGNIVPHPDNRAGLRAVESKNPRRLEGDLSTSDIFTGRWFHPVETSRYHGTFQLLLHASGSVLSGKWLGYSQSEHDIISGEWVWTRMP